LAEPSPVSVTAAGVRMPTPPYTCSGPGSRWSGSSRFQHWRQAWTSRTTTTD
jgi:hypothetical protein